jgi:hypothetical protein
MEQVLVEIYQAKCESDLNWDNMTFFNTMFLWPEL